MPKTPKSNWTTLAPRPTNTSPKHAHIEEARAAAAKEAQKVMDAAKLSIEQQQKEAQKQLRNQVSEIALEIAGKVVKENMADQAAQSRLVNTYLDQIENNN